MTDFPLTYFRKSDGKEFKGRTKIQNLQIELFDPETNEVKLVSKSWVNQNLKGSPENRYRTKPTFTSKAWKEKYKYDYENKDFKDGELYA